MERVAELAATFAAQVTEQARRARARAVIEAVAESLPIKATVHPYGFLVIRLFDAEGRQVRLHIWDQGTRRRQQPDWPIHNHPWKLTSLVLTGEVGNDSYNVKRSSAGRFVIYSVAYEPPYSVLNKSSTFVEAELVSRDSIGVGRTYSVAAESFHVNDVSEDRFAATLMVAYPDRRSVPEVVGDRDGNQQYRYERATIDPAVVAKAVKRVAREVAAL